MEEDLLGTDLELQISTTGADLIVDRMGDLKTVAGKKNLGQAILHRLMTRTGELGDLGHPHYGSRLHELIGEPNNERTRDLLRLYIKECLAQEPRIQEVVSIKLATFTENAHLVVVDISVLPIKVNTPINLVFPFYLEVG